MLRVDNNCIFLYYGLGNLFSFFGTFGLSEKYTEKISMAPALRMTHANQRDAASFLLGSSSGISFLFFLSLVKSNFFFPFHLYPPPKRQRERIKARCRIMALYMYVGM